MNCPTCNVPLVIAERHQVEIDYCPRCRGVWLDRGELDKILDRAAPASPSHRDEPYRDKVDRDDDHKGYRKKKREGFLSEIFDF